MAANMKILNNPADTAQVYEYIKLGNAEQAFMRRATTTRLPALGEFERRKLVEVLDVAFFELHMRMMLDDTLKVFENTHHFELHRRELAINKTELARIVETALNELQELFARHG